MKPPIKEAFNSLFTDYGRQHWWPAESDLEMMVGAILTQNTAWTNVENALNNLRANNALNAHTLAETPRETVAEWIRPAGHFNQKSEYIKEMIQTIMDRFNGSIDELFKLETAELRTELLSWKGIGPETADSILLYAAKRPVFVIDAYTRRVASRHGWISEKSKYDEIAGLFTDNLPEDTQLFNEYHALIVRLCKDHCKTKPECSDCPLNALLPKN